MRVIPCQECSQPFEANTHNVSLCLPCRAIHNRDRDRTNQRAYARRKRAKERAERPANVIIPRQRVKAYLPVPSAQKRPLDLRNRTQRAKQEKAADTLPTGYAALLEAINEESPYLGKDFEETGQGAKRGITSCGCGSRGSFPQACPRCQVVYCHKCAAYRHTGCAG